MLATSGLSLTGKAMAFGQQAVRFIQTERCTKGMTRILANVTGEIGILFAKKTCIDPYALTHDPRQLDYLYGRGWEKSTKIVEGTWGEGGIYGDRGEKLTIIQAGSGKGKKCPDASCADIKSCIKAVAAEWKTGKTYCLPGTNCRDFVTDVLQRCALNRASQAK